MPTWWPPKSRKTWLTPAAEVLCSNASLGRKVNIAQGKIPSGGKNVYTVYSSLGDGQTLCKVWLASGERRRCGNAAKTRNPLKLAGVPQPTGPISAASGPKFTILWGHMEEVLMLNKLFPIVDVCLSCKDTARQNCVMVPLPDGKFLAIFCVLYFQRATCSTCQTCILNSH